MTGQPFDFADRSVVVTGAAGAIGTAVASRFALAGANITGLDISPGDGIIGCDIMDEASIAQALADVTGGDLVTDLVHGAGAVSVGNVLSVPTADSAPCSDVNLTGAFIIARAVGPLMGRGAAMTFLGSQAAAHGAPGWAAYCAAKAGVARPVEALAKELGPNGIRVNAVCPGTVDSPMTRQAIGLIAAGQGADADMVKQRYERENPLGGWRPPMRSPGSACSVITAGELHQRSLDHGGRGDRPG